MAASSVKVKVKKDEDLIRNDHGGNLALHVGDRIDWSSVAGICTGETVACTEVGQNF
jgi:hypothetical protein